MIVHNIAIRDDVTPPELLVYVKLAETLTKLRNAKRACQQLQHNYDIVRYCCRRLHQFHVLHQDNRQYLARKAANFYGLSPGYLRRLSDSDFLYVVRTVFLTKLKFHLENLASLRRIRREIRALLKDLKVAQKQVN